MTAPILQQSLEKDLAIVETEIEELKWSIACLSRPAQEDFAPKMERIETMAAAFARDIGEIESDAGADPQKVHELSNVLSESIDQLFGEVESRAHAEQSLLAQTPGPFHQGRRRMTAQIPHTARSDLDRFAYPSIASPRHPTHLERACSCDG